jgi:riboflavin synthase
VFTGIVESVGRVASVSPVGTLVRLRVEAERIADQVGLGDSIAVNGCCLTVTGHSDACIDFDAVQETLDRTALGGLAPGSRVNLERALRADSRLDGHIVQGHVDGIGRVQRLERDADDVRLDVACDAELAGLLVHKGSVAVDGVSLTLAAVSELGFQVALIPHTLEVTTLGERRPGDIVNLEADVLGKYVRSYLERVLPRGGAEC